MHVRRAASIRPHIVPRIVSCCGLAFVAHAQAQSHIEWIGDLTKYPFTPATPTWPNAVSADGKVVVGSSATPEGPSIAFRWTHDEGMISLGDLPGAFERSVANGVSADGSVVVGQGWSQNGFEAFVWTAEGGMVGLGDLPGGSFSSSASAVSADGRVVVGTGSTDLGNEAFIWTSETGMVGLGHLPGSANSSAVAVNAAGDRVLGVAASNNSSEPFLWTKSTGMVGLGTFPGETQCNACDISNDGSVVVGWAATDGNPGSTGFRWTATNGYSPLADFPSGGAESRGFTVSDDGGLIGGWATNEFGTHAAVWTDPAAPRDFQEYLLTEYQLDSSSWMWLTDVFAMSGNGRNFIGIGRYSGAYYQSGSHAWVAHVEPPCAADCSADGHLDLFDFLCFVNEFNAADPYADCTDDGFLDLFDFLCFVNQFNAGC